VPLGGVNVTNDIAIGLRTNLASAEQLKMRFASSDPRTADAAQTEVEIVDDGVARPARRSDVTEIIEARMHEIFEKVGEEIADHASAHRLPAGLVITGGGAQLSGLAELGRDVLGIPVRMASPQGVGGLTDHLLTPAYATAIGLLLWAARVTSEQERERYEPPPAAPGWDRVRDMVRRFFP
jgi:cell division protein FtsA